MLWTVELLATTTMLSPSAPPNPSSAIAPLESFSSRARYRLIHPGTSDDPGAILRAHVVLIELDHRVDRVTRDQSALGQQRLERPGTELDR